MFNRMQSLDMQSVHFFQKDNSNKKSHKGSKTASFRAIVAIHNTHLGPALGGCRCLRYDNENLALDDAMRLAQGMSYKAALANVSQGGGKSVILLPRGSFDREALFSWFGDCIETLKGQYITAMDSGTDVSDMDVLARQTGYVASAKNIGDPAPFTAQGVFVGIQAAIQFRLNKPLAQSRIAVQGLGHVGLRLCSLLIDAGADVVATDPDENKCLKAKMMGVSIVAPDEIYTQVVDVFSPCALGNTINDESLSLLKCSVIAGSANNQLKDESLAMKLFQKKILYAPDFVINSGGLIYASSRYHHQDQNIDSKVNGIADTLTALFDQAQQENSPIDAVALERAKTIIAGEPLIRTKAGVNHAA